ncbi:hypothetical protein C8A01DRAFT_38214 [Parachaetomium inaequale]|uniref:Centrosomin N-terminal motif 1 domain-containing protein n=1 Tax=Parachaetomium inaequale TaxID=2588326 RepID=A0AAN6PG03_9PEZI|nr:hypothetical protein C8A01DRAFT_38214 [Parachaetomium inaequale]
MDGYGAPSRTGSSLARTHRTQPAENPQSSPVNPISPLLLERLQRSRRVENDRVSSRSSTDMLSSSAGSRHVRSPSPTGSHRPGSSGALDPAKAKKGLGVKEMEQTLSTLHKQNFDLKLELYHRRERQTALEERLEALEREAKERDDLNDSLVHELEKRDKAVEEAIGMILTLEKRVEQLLLERKMVRQVEAPGAAYPRIDSPVTTPASKNTKFDSSPPFGDAKTPVRMPSFVSERSENTENLRSVYLGALACESALTLPRLTEDTPDTARMDPRLASPALSELSESSFISVYGHGRTVDLSSPPGNSPWPWDRSSRTPVPVLESPTRVRTSTPSRQHRPSSSRASSGQYHNIGDVLDVGRSPLQQLEKLNPARAAMRDSPRLQTATKEQSPFARPPTSHTQPKTKKEKREALEKVLTQGHFSSPQTLPPTPDTLSTTTLPHNETPSKDHSPENDRSFLFLTETNTSRASGHDEHKSPSCAAQPPSTTAFDSRKHLHDMDGASHSEFATPDSHAPPPAAGSTNARANGLGGEAPKYKATHRRDSTTSSVDTWLRESLKPESMDALDPMSSVSQTHGSAKTGRISPDLFSFPTSTGGWAANAMFGSLGGKGYSGTGGKQASATPIADMLAAIGASVPTPPIPGAGRMTPVHAAAAPPPPNRRSSLLARTRPTADATPGTESILQSPPRPAASTSSTNSPARGNRARSNSTDPRSAIRHLTELGLKQDRAMTVPPKQVHAPPPPKQQDTPSKHDSPSQPLPKQRHYPPQSQTSRPRSRGLNTFFRRSTGSAGSADVPAPPASAPPTQTAFKPPPPPPQAGSGSGSGSGMGMGMPSWVRRGSLPADDDRASATPPPILRNKGVPQSSSAGGIRVVDDEDGDGGVVLEEPLSTGGGGVSLGTVPAGKPSSRKSWGGSSGGTGGEGGEGGGVSLGGGGGGGGKRKWLGLGRVSSLRNRGGA